MMEDTTRPPTFLIDLDLWDRFNSELRAACHWCTHHHTTTPAEAAKQLDRGDGWPKDWVSRKVKNSTRQFGGLFICPAADCSGHNNSKGERRRRWFCRFCINRHLGVDLKNFFQLDELQGRWIQNPSLICWHCRAKIGDASCVNCPQKHTKRSKRAIDAPVAAVPVSFLGAAGDIHFQSAGNDAVGAQSRSVQSVDDKSYVTAEVRLPPPHHTTSSAADLRFLTSASQQSRWFFSDKGFASGELQAQGSVIQSLLNFVNNSCTPFHATAEARKHLLGIGFQQLSECEEWQLQPGGRYFFTRNMSSIYAFAVGRKFKPGSGFHVLAAHMDSPCLKLKPVSASSKGKFLHVRVQTYGTGLWHTWFDRDLSIAGRVLIRRKGGELAHELVRIRRPILRIPTVAFYSERSETGDKSEMDSQLAPLLAMQIEAELTMSGESGSTIQAEHSISPNYSPHEAHHPVLLQVLADELKCEVSEIADFELSVYDTQPGCVGGARDEFVFSGRLDNLASSFCALWALLETCSDPVALAEESSVRMVALFDNGEVGLDSVQGPGPQTMFQTMTRIARWLARGSNGEGIVERSIRRSFIVSADMAHAWHPSYTTSSEEHHHPKMHEGLVIKHDVNQSHATDAITSFLFKELAKRSCIPTQSFPVMRDVGCCSTVDSILASGYGIRVVDCGLPQLSMHSVREMCGTEDIEAAVRHFKAFFADFTSLEDQLRVDI